MEMNVTKLKLKIKEIKTRKLTDEEKIMVDVCKFLGPKMDTKSLYNVCRDYLANRGIIFADGFISELETPYSTTTIRDATPEEYRAWTYLQLVKHCACPERKISSLDCHDCFLSGACVASDFKTKIAIYILKGKEVILSVIEE